MRRAKIVDVKQEVYGATNENTRIRQRDKLEETMVNLATFLGAKEVRRAHIVDGSYIYSVKNEFTKVLLTRSSIFLARLQGWHGEVRYPQRRQLPSPGHQI